MNHDEFASRTYERILKPHHSGLKEVRVYKSQEDEVEGSTTHLTTIQVERNGMLFYDWTNFRSIEEMEIFSTEFHYTIANALDAADGTTKDDETFHHWTRYQMKGKWLFENGYENEPELETLSTLIRSAERTHGTPEKTYKHLLSVDLRKELEKQGEALA